MMSTYVVYGQLGPKKKYVKQYNELKCKLLAPYDWTDEPTAAHQWQDEAAVQKAVQLMYSSLFKIFGYETLNTTIL